MKVLPVALILAVGLPAFADDSPPKRGLGFFGFGTPPANQISGDLFPQEGGSAPSPSASGGSNDGIFRGGQPQKVEPVSYVIENGRRVERPAPAPLKKPEPAAPVQTLSAPTPAKPIVAAPAPAAAPVAAPVEPVAEKKRAPWFGFGKRDEESAPENPVLTPVPAAAPLLGATPVASESKPSAKPKPVSAPVPAPIAAKPVAAKPVEATSPSPVMAPTPSGVTGSGDTPDFANVKEEKGEKFGWIPFLGRKKDDEAPAAPASMPAATPVVAETVAATPAPAAKPADKPAATETAPAAKPGEKPAGPQVATYEIRRDESKPVEPDKKEKSDRDGGILTPITKIRPPKKEIDLTGAETIIQNGEIVGETDSLAATVQTDNSPRQAPQVVNGVKTYSSWNDVDARSSSAADKIIQRIR